LALQLFTTSGADFHKDDFARAIKAVTNIEISSAMVDTIFTVFDDDGSGTLHYDELVGTLKKRRDFSLSAPRDTGFLRFIKCTQDCWFK
jgi:calcium uptake protein 3, mitochondrial